MAGCLVMLKKAVLVIPLSLVCISLNGCYDIYKETCVWHSDMTIKECSYYTFRSCIQHCHYCITSGGPQECSQLKCVAYCAKRDDDGCIDNYKALCNIAKLDAVFTNSSCDVNCNGAASRNPTKVLSFLVVGYLFSTLSSRQATFGALLIFAAAHLHGCCTDPEPQLDWEPDLGDFKKKADWFDDKGVWRGNPTWRYFKELEVEDYECKNSENGICLVWTLHEWNCGEHDFGVCKCHKLDNNQQYCEEWGCHALEADQEVCYIQHTTDSDGNSQSEEACSYSHFPMTEQVYWQLVENQERGGLTTGEAWYRWGSVIHWRRLEAEETNANTTEEHDIHEVQKKLREKLGVIVEGNTSEIASPVPFAESRQLTYYGGWPPMSVYNPEARHLHYRWSGVCIVNGDNKAMARRNCDSWREIETEISQCKCLSGKGKACMRWTCEERDVGLFSVLFRTKEDIKPYTDGSETENYECLQLASDGTCAAWEGDISSREEVEWTRCECKGSCAGLGARWYCDEYELPKTLVWNHPHYENGWLWFVFAEFFGVCVFCRVFGDGQEDALPVGLCCSCCTGVCIFPWLITTWGCYAWLAIGMPFWLVRLCFCCVLFAAPVCKKAGEEIADVLEGDKPKQVSSKDRFKRGASKIIGKKQAVKVQNVPEEETY